MAKFSGASAVKQAQAGALGQIELPTEQTPAPTPQTPQQEAPTGSSILAELQAYSPDQQAAVAETQAAVGEALPELMMEEQRQAIPSLNERAQGGPRVDRWLRPPTQPLKKANPAIDSQSPDAGLMDRANAMAKNVDSMGLMPILSARGISAEVTAADKAGVTGPELAEQIAAEREGSLLAAMERVNAIQPKQTSDGRTIKAPDPRYVAVASAVTENQMAEMMGGQTNVDPDPVAQALQEQTVEGKEEMNRPVTHAEGNARIGQEIHQEYQRVQGVQNPEKLPQKEAETLGATFKDMWAQQNPKLVTKNIDPATNQYVYQLSALGESVMKNGAEDRKRLFPKTNVRPAKQPLVTGRLPGDVGQSRTKKTQGAVGSPDFSNTIENAMKNLAQVPNVVDKQRAKILFSTILPVLQSGDHSTWMAEINNFGPGKIQKFQAKVNDMKKAGNYDPNEYSVEGNLAALADKIAQEVRAVAQERKGANFLSYSVQGFQGRISPQQSFFDPTTSKAVRFVTRNATPSIAKPGSRVEKNLRQMYAMMLVKGADEALPPIREQKLNAAAPQLEAWGTRLEEALAMSDAEYEAVAQAIEEGVPLTDPNFPKFSGLNLDPEKDADLIAAINSKGEDGPHFIDGLIDFKNYMNAKRGGRAYPSYFNAYIDGKTNGIASNGIQMGSVSLAERTGVLRDTRQGLLDDGDVRAQLKDIAVNSIADGWDGDTDGFEAELNDVAETLYSYRDLNKKTTMTFGYGKEISSFQADFEEALGFLAESTDSETYSSSLEAAEQALGGRKQVAEVLLGKYAGALEQVMSTEALETRTLMRAASALHAATNQLFSIKGPTGMDLNLGGDVTTGYADADLTKVKYADGREINVAHYKTEPTAAAAKSRIVEDDMGNEIVEQTPGEKAYGGSVVAPVQALDAATVALAASGKSWERMRQASGGNPYMHTIYDAFKLDANGFDVGLEEINKNWFNSSMKWSYLQSTYDATKDKMKAWQQEMKQRNPNDAVTDNERAYLDWMMTVDQGKPVNFNRKMPKFKDYPEGKDRFDAMKKDFAMLQSAMRKVGYHPDKPVTNRQLQTFVSQFAGLLNLSSRMSKKIQQTDANKAKVKAEIMKRGYKTPSGERIALQYYAH